MLYRLDKEMLHDDFENFYKFYLNKKEQYKDDFLGLIFEYNKRRQRIGTIIVNSRFIIELAFPYFVKEILNWLEKDSQDFQEGMTYACILIALVTLRGWIAIFGPIYFNKVNARIRANVRVIFFSIILTVIELNCPQNLEHPARSQKVRRHRESDQQHDGRHRKNQFLRCL